MKREADHVQQELSHKQKHSQVQITTYSHVLLSHAGVKVWHNQGSKYPFFMTNIRKSQAGEPLPWSPPIPYDGNGNQLKDIHFKNISTNINTNIHFPKKANLGLKSSTPTGKPPNSPSQPTTKQMSGIHSIYVQLTSQNPRI